MIEQAIDLEHDVFKNTGKYNTSIKLNDEDRKKGLKYTAKSRTLKTYMMLCVTIKKTETLQLRI